MDLMTCDMECLLLKAGMILLVCGMVETRCKGCTAVFCFLLTEVLPQPVKL